MTWFNTRSEKVKLEHLEERVAILEKRLLSAAEILDVTERLDRITKRSFRLKAQMELLEKEKEAPNNGPALSRREILNRFR